MKRIFAFFFTMTLILNLHAQTTANYATVPLPQTIQLSDSEPFILNDARGIAYPSATPELAKEAEFLASYIKEICGISLPINALPSQTDSRRRARVAPHLIILHIDNALQQSLGAEGYSVSVSAKEINIKGASAAGVFYASQMLRKALPIVNEGEKITLPAADISDSPRFAYRGMLLDCARHFFSVDFVKHYIDLIALHQMNRFHWHLTDDQGWRIEIKRYPELTKIGSQRTWTVLGKNSDVGDGTPYGGFYTQEQIREVIAYAAERHITVIPEIDLPGHMMAALTAYPHLGCVGKGYEVGHYWGVYKDILCAGNPQTLEFLYGVFEEICQLFPSQIIHIGGDESPRVRWENCPKCQQTIKANHLKNEAELQGWMTNKISAFLAKKGRRIMGWDELLDTGVDQNAVIMSWRGAEPGASAAKRGHDVVMTPTTHAYFDYHQTKDIEFEPRLIGGCVTVEKVYSFEPVDASLSATDAKHILGVQANLWSEYITCNNLAEYQVLPRMAALSEVQWMQPSQKDYKQFVERADRLRQLYEKLCINYARHIWRDKLPRKGADY